MKIEEFIPGFILSKYSNVYVIDITKDMIFNYTFDKGVIKYLGKNNYSTYLSILNTLIHPDDINNYTDCLSNTKINSNNNKIKCNFRKKVNDNYVLYSNYIYLVNNLIIVLEKVSLDIDDKEKEVVTDNRLTDYVSEVLLKIHNIFNTGSPSEEMHTTGNYINTLLSDAISKFPVLNDKFLENAVQISGRDNQTLLIIDDDKITCTILKKIFEEYYDVVITNDGKEGIEYLKSLNSKNQMEGAEDVVCIFLDLAMPVMDGFAVLEYLNKNNYLSKIPVAIISGDYSKETREKVYSYQIADMLEKPFNAEVIKHRITNLVSLYRSSNSLNQMILNQYSDLRDIIFGIYNKYLSDHKEKIITVKNVVKSLATQIMNDNPSYGLNMNKIDSIVEASSFYELSYSLLPNSLIVKNNNYVKEDYKIINEYNELSIKLVKYCSEFNKNPLFMLYVEEIIKNINENYDGTGYPNGKKDSEVTLSSQIASIAALYVKTNNINDVISLSGTKYNSVIIDSLKKIVK